MHFLHSKSVNGVENASKKQNKFMPTYRYTLEPYKGMHTRYTCPACRKQKQFTRYINTETGAYIADNVGACNRQNKCQYDYTPKQYFKDHEYLHNSKHQGIIGKRKQLTKKAIVSNPRKTEESTMKNNHTTSSPTNISYISKEIFQKSLQGYNSNHLIQHLYKRFPKAVVDEALEKYKIGTAKHWLGATVFWQIDIEGKIRTGKIILYNPETGKRVKEPFNHINWIHSILKLENFQLRQCFFGEHLLKEDVDKPVAIVESEKTAITCSICSPELIWLAAGSLQNLSIEKAAVLKGRRVFLFPDLNGYDQWNEKAKNISFYYRDIVFTVSQLLEQNATEEERKEGLDIADYLLAGLDNSIEEESSEKSIDTHPNNSQDIVPSEVVQNPDLIHITEEDAEKLCVTNKLTEEFDYAVIATIKLKNGKYMDILCDKDGGAMDKNNTALVEKVGRFFNKNFVQIMLDDEPSWVHWV